MCSVFISSSSGSASACTYYSESGVMLGSKSACLFGLHHCYICTCFLNNFQGAQPLTLSTFNSPAPNRLGSTYTSCTPTDGFLRAPSKHLKRGYPKVLLCTPCNTRRIQLTYRQFERITMPITCPDIIASSLENPCDTQFYRE